VLTCLTSHCIRVVGEFGALLGKGRDMPPKPLTPSGSAGAILMSQILAHFLEALNKMGTNLTKVPPKNQPIIGNGGLLIGSADLLWLLALKCMYTFSQYNLILQQTDIEQNGKKVGGFIDCIVKSLKAHNWTVIQDVKLK
jgi:hypothetical protein